MRISWAALLVLLAIATPFLIQIRTVGYMIGVDLSVLQVVAISGVVIGSILAWALELEQYVTE